MAQTTIISLNNAPAIVLPLKALEESGLSIGDTVEVTVNSGRVGVAPPAQASQQEVERLSDEIIDRRRDAYERLA